MGWFKLPAPTSFAEGQRMAFAWLMALAGIFCGISAAAVVYVLWRGGWTLETEGQRITVISLALIGFIAGMLCVIIGLMIGGPVGRFKGSLNQDGGQMEVGGRDDAPPQQNVEVNVNG